MSLMMVRFSMVLETCCIEKMMVSSRMDAYSYHLDMPVRTGVDLGGTKIEVVVLQDDEIRARVRCGTPQGDYAGSVQAVADLVSQAEAEAGITAPHVGVGAPGSPSPSTGLQRNSNSIALNDMPLADNLATAINRPVRLANDANCLALSEAWNGAGAGHGTVFAVILGTGVGGGLVVDGTLLKGCNGVGGEFGHTALPRPTTDEVPGPTCYCGLNGCIEGWLAGPAMEAQWCALGHAPLTATAIAADASEDAKDLLDRWLDRLARALANAVSLVDPDVIVIGGGLNAIDAIYDRIPGMLGPLVFGGACSTPVVAASHGDSSGVLGAARL